MKAITYNVTATSVPGLVQNFHHGVERGYAYETSSHFVHFYGSLSNWYSIHTGLTILEAKNGSLDDWAKKWFGASNIKPMHYDVGHSINGVWRPGLYYYKDTYQALNTTEEERRLNEQALRVILEKFDELLLYIEPDPASFASYSHKIRELLVLACTEVENSWAHFLSIAGTAPTNGRVYNTVDYVKLSDALFLNEYQCSLRGYTTSIPPFNSFNGWNSTQPTQSLPWYDDYNKSKHNRTIYFRESNFKNALFAVVANVILYIVRFSPFPMIEESGTFNSLINQHFKFELSNPDLSKVYIPLIEVPHTYRSDIFLYDAHKAGDLRPYVRSSLVV